jgi:hypothetical protein
MPGTVSEVSATLVASTMRRPLPAVEHPVLLGLRQAREQRQDLGVRPIGLRDRCLRRWSAASRISRSPGRKTRMSPPAPRHNSSTASAMASFRSMVALLLETAASAAPPGTAGPTP